MFVDFELIKQCGYILSHFLLTFSLSTQESIVLGVIRFKTINTIFDPRILYWADRAMY